MNADTDDHCPERIMIISTNHHLLQMIVIQNTVIYALAGSTFAIDGTVKIGATWYAWMKAQVSADLKVNSSAITAVGTFTGARTFADFAAFIRAAVFDGMFYFIITAMIHPKPGLA